MSEYQSRSEAFGEGQEGGATVRDTSETMQHGSGTFRPNGQNMQLAITPTNGNGPADAERQLMGGGEVQNANGMASKTYSAKRPLLSTGLGV